MVLSTIAAEQSKATELIIYIVKQLLDYCTMHPNARITYKNLMPWILVHPKIQVAWLDTSSLDGYSTTNTQSNWMDLYTFSHPSYDLLLYLLLKQNLVLCLSMPMRVKSFISFVRKWDSPNHPHQLIVIIPMPLELQMTFSIKKFIIHGNVILLDCRSGCTTVIYCSLAPKIWTSCQLLH